VDTRDKTGSANTILCQIFLNSIQEVNSQNQTATIDISVQLWYIQDEAVGAEGDVAEWSDDVKSKVWKPVIDFIGNIDLEECVPNDGSFYIREDYSKYGVVNWYQKYKGNIMVDLDLRDFPFDRQMIRIKFGATSWSSSYISLKNITSEEQVRLFSVGMKLTEWDLVGQPKIEDAKEFMIEDQRLVSFINVDIPLRRISGYYLTHVIFLIFLINVMSWTVFVCGNQLSSRLSLDMALFLALVALNFVVIGFIPKVSYGTKLTQYFVVSYFFITFDTLQNVVSYLISTYYCINGYDPWALPLVNGTLEVPSSTLGPCNSALYFDWFSVLFVAACEILYTIVYISIGNKVLPGETVIRQHDLPESLKEKHD